jgi:stringent starvation protein B
MMTTTRPYLIRAFYDWIVDNDCTPHLVVNAEFESVVVPLDYVEAGQIVLNISMNAVSDLELGQDAIQFSARFKGESHDIYVPIGAVLAVYAKENGRGMVFSEDDFDSTNPPPPPPPKGKGKGDKGSKDEKGKGKGGKSAPPHLTIVK